jgi:plasmid stability protein
MQNISIRGIPPDLAKALQEEKDRRGQSLNRTVRELLRRALGLGPNSHYDNGLAAHAGTWSEQDLREFERATSAFGQIDEELWK